MSTIDQAFIKAFSEGIAQTRHEPATARPADAAEAGSLSPRASVVPQPHVHFAGTIAMAATSVGDKRPSASPSSGPDHMIQPLNAQPSPAPISAARPLSAFGPPHMASGGEPAAAPRPALEVDRFAWPDMCELLIGRSEARFDALAGELTTESTLGRKVVAVAGLRRGEGGSTVALCVARRAAAAGLKVALVDADYNRPELADLLGLAIEQGWEATLSGVLPIWELLIESVEDRLTLLPLGRSLPAADPLRQAVALGILREHFDLVLVDAGPVPAAADAAQALAPAAGIDAAILVRDVRSPDAAALTDACRRLEMLGLPLVGISENFCA